jgi:ribonuclease PH
LAEVEEPKKEEPKEDALSSILRNVEKLKDQPKPKKQQVAKAQEQAPEPEASMLEQMELVRLIQKQLEACWRLEPGARDAEDLAVTVRVALNKDGSVRNAEIEDVSRMMADAYYRTAAENALRAIYKCSPFKGLPIKRYAVWRDMRLNFNPSEMF